MTEAMKCVMIINEDLPVGLAVNTAGVLALTIGSKIPSIIGTDVVDASGQIHVGITTIPIPILKAKEDVISHIRTQANDGSDLLVVDFTNAAQTTTTYDDYRAKISSMAPEDLRYLGIAIYGSKKYINKLTGNLSLLR